MKEQEMMKMRVDGATYQEIADRFGITRQRVYNILYEYSRKITAGARGRAFSFLEIKFKGIRQHFADNDTETTCKFSEKVGVQPCTMRNFLKGKSESYFTIPQIKRICEVVGKPFEEVFEEG